MVFSTLNCTGVLPPTILPFITAGFSALLFFLAVPGNFLIILAIYKDPNKELRNPFNLFVGNLASADLAVGLVVLPISVVLHIREGLLDYPHGVGIQLIHMTYFIACTASLLSLAALTVDRHVAVTYPIYYRTTLSPKRAFIASFLIWIVSIGMPFIYFHVGYINYAFVFANIAIVVTLFFLFSCLHIIRRIGKRSGPVKTNFNADDDDPAINNTLRERKTRQQQRNTELQVRLTRVFATVLIAYLLCYGPSCVIIYLMNFCSSCTCEQIHWFRDMQFIFVLLNSCTNPFLYSWRLKTFRTALKKILGFKESTKKTSSSIGWLNSSNAANGAFDNLSMDVRGSSAIELEHSNLAGTSLNETRASPLLLSVQKLSIDEL